MASTSKLATSPIGRSIQSSICEKKSNACRIGRLDFTHRQPLLTPGYLSAGIRGAIPHLTPDISRLTRGPSLLHVALEDYIGPSLDASPLYQCDNLETDSALRAFSSISRDTVICLGPHRAPSQKSKSHNSNNAVLATTSFGILSLDHRAYAETQAKLNPDMIFGLVEIGPSSTPSKRQMQRMVCRTETWMRSLIDVQLSMDEDQHRPAIIAPILPLESAVQRDYLKYLESVSHIVKGIAVYDVESLKAIPLPLEHLPRIFLGCIEGPSEMLKIVREGVDIVLPTFLNDVSDGGIALNFKFSQNTKPEANIRSLFVDLWSPDFATDKRPIASHCGCHACKWHSRAYLHHLLEAKEMLAWVLIQIHNHHIMDAMFYEIRQSLKNGDFESKVQDFDEVYKDDVLVSGGCRPRTRGYNSHRASQTEKPNDVAYRKL